MDIIIWADGSELKALKGALRFCLDAEEVIEKIDGFEAAGKSKYSHAAILLHDIYYEAEKVKNVG